MKGRGGDEEWKEEVNGEREGEGSVRGKGRERGGGREQGGLQSKTSQGGGAECRLVV